MVTKEEIDAACDALEAAFRALAEAEDRYSEIESELSSMIRKVALVQALREAFPSDLGGMYDAAEVGEEVD